MNRRQVIVSSLASVFPFREMTTILAQDATPEVQDDVDLGDDLRLSGHRFTSIVGNSIPAFVGEYVNDGDQAI